MPLRRPPPEPSPRLRALLASTAVAPKEVAPKEGGLRKAAPGDAVTKKVASGEAALVPWQPDRAWIERAAEAGDSVGNADHPGPVGHVGRGRHRRPAPPRARLFTLPEALVGARLSGPRAAVAGLLIVAVVAAIGFGVRVAWARAASTPEVVAPAQPGSAVGGRASGSTGFASSSTASGGGGPPTAGSSAAASAAGSSGVSMLTVHVVGQVRKPGVIKLPAGSRVTDAVAKAGGALHGADLAAVNLARPLTDGEQVRIPKPGESAAPVGGGSGGPTVGGGSGGPSGATPGGPVGGADAKVDLNRATAAELEELPGVGPVLAQRIVDWRTEHGRFANVDELGEVSGIGEKIFAQLQPKVTV